MITLRPELCYLSLRHPSCQSYHVLIQFRNIVVGQVVAAESELVFSLKGNKETCFVGRGDGGILEGPSTTVTPFKILKRVYKKADVTI